MDWKAITTPSMGMTYFRLKLEESANSSSICTVTKDCPKSYLQITYQFIFEHCYDLYRRDYPFSIETGPFPEDRYPRLDSLKFWHMLIIINADLLKEKRRGEDPVLNKLPRELNIDQLSAATIWSRLVVDLKCALQEHEQLRLCHCTDYLNLNFRVKNFYNEFMQEVPEYKNIVPEYPSWFEPFVMEWLDTINHKSLEYVHKAFCRDKTDGFQTCSDDLLFSNSVVDIFTQLTEYFKVVSELKCPDPEIQQRYLKYFTDIVVKVLTTYVRILCQEFPTDIKEGKIACILMNNIQQLILQLEKLITKMHDLAQSDNAITTLKELEKSFDSSADELVIIFIHSSESKIKKSVEEVGEELMNIKDSQSNQGIQNNIVAAEADRISKPLLDLLDDMISLYAANLEEIVFQKYLKRLWKVILRFIETNLALPFKTDKMMTSITLMDKAVNKINDPEIEDIPKGISREEEESLKQLFPLQCAILEKSLHILSDYFHAYGDGLKKKFLEQSPELRTLRCTLTLYIQTILQQRECRMSNETGCLGQGGNDTASFEELLYEYNLHFEQAVDEKTNCVKLLPQFRYSRADLPMYPSSFPISMAESQIILETAVQPSTSKMFFHMKIQELLNSSIISTVMEDCVKACVQSTYHYLFENCSYLYEQEYLLSKKTGLLRKERHPCIISLQFWDMLIPLMIAVVKKSKKSYNSAFNKFPSGLNIGQITAATMWSLFAVDLKYALQEHKNHPKCHCVGYKKVRFSVKNFYVRYVQKVPLYKNVVPEYLTWFEPM